MAVPSRKCPALFRSALPQREIKRMRAAQRTVTDPLGGFGGYQNCGINDKVGLAIQSRPMRRTILRSAGIVRFCLWRKHSPARLAAQGIARQYIPAGHFPSDILCRRPASAASPPGGGRFQNTRWVPPRGFLPKRKLHETAVTAQIYAQRSPTIRQPILAFRQFS